MKGWQRVWGVTVMLVLAAPAVRAGGAALAGADRPKEAARPAPAVNPKAVVWRTPAPPEQPQAGDVWVNPKDAAEMVYVSDGWFHLGTSGSTVDDWVGAHPEDTADNFDGERPECYLHTGGFWISRTEVTNEQYSLFARATGRTPPSYWSGGAIPSGLSAFPVVGVTWDDARAYSEWAGGRLPGELEWQKAARGPDGHVFPWGDAWDEKRCRHFGTLKDAGSVGTASVVAQWVRSHDPVSGGPVKVGSYPAGASPWGCLDMSGNVSEWCGDVYDPRAYRRYLTDKVTEMADVGDQLYVVTGSSWLSLTPGESRCARRWRASMRDRSLDRGCRYVLANGGDGRKAIDRISITWEDARELSADELLDLARQDLVAAMQAAGSGDFDSAKSRSSRARRYEAAVLEKTASGNDYCTLREDWASRTLLDGLFDAAEETGDATAAEAWVALRMDVNARQGGTPLLYRVTGKKHTGLVAMLLARGADVNAKTQDGDTPLHQAAAGGSKDIVEMLLDKRAEVNARNNDGETPLHRAALAGAQDIVEILLARGADVNARDESGKTALLPAAAAGRTEVVKLLIARGGDVKAADGHGRTALHEAAERRDDEGVISVLLASGADVNAKDVRGETPLQLVAKDEKKKDTVVLLMRNGAISDTKGPNGLPLVIWALESGDRELATLASRQCTNTKVTDYNGKTPLHWAAKLGYDDAVSALLAKGADANAVDRSGESALDQASAQGYKSIVVSLLHHGARADVKNQAGCTALYRAARDGNRDMVAALLAGGANANMKDEATGLTPLHEASSRGYKEVVRTLLASGAAINPRDLRGRTPLHAAAGGGYKEIVELLLAKGAQVNPKDQSGSTPLSLAQGEGVAEVLRKHGGKP